GSASGNAGSTGRDRAGAGMGDGSVPMAPGVSVPLASAGCCGAVSSSEVRLPSRDFVIRPGATGGGGAAAASRGAGKAIAADRGRTGSGVHPFAFHRASANATHDVNRLFTV